MALLGVDIGSQNIAVVILEKEDVIYQQVKSQNDEMQGPRQVLENSIKEAGLRDTDITHITATGRGRNRLDTAKKSSEVVCQARGAIRLFPTARTVINIGAESSRVISINENGRVSSFVTNDKCAAGTGLFLESMAHLMNLSMAEIGDLALSADSYEEVSSRCAIFAESEVISHIHKGITKERILAGLHHAVALRILELTNRVSIKPDVVFTGGVAKNSAIKNELESQLELSLLIPRDPLVVGALGAALLNYHSQ